MDTTTPLISVITVCYNAEKELEQTILSVINQTYKNIEYIIIDGGSSDSSIDIIKKYNSKISYWISESDNGIYDAMNKGIKIATGIYISFMNAGDCFYSLTTIEEISKYLSINRPDIIYGNANFIYEWGMKMKIPYPIETLNKRMAFCHLASLVKTTLMKQELFDTSFKISSDYNFLYHQFKARKQFLYIPICIANFDAVFGISSRNYFLARKENAIINGSINSISWKIECLKIRITYFIKKILPQSFVLKIREYKNKSFN